MCVCCWVETECIAVGGATTCTHAQYFLDLNLIHAGLWRPGALLIPIITHLLSWYVNDRLRPSKHSITSEAKSQPFFTGPFLHALSGAMHCTPSQSLWGSWLCLVVLVKAWGVLDWRHCFPANNCCLNGDNSTTTAAESMLESTHVLGLALALIHPDAFLFSFLLYLTIELWNVFLKAIHHTVASPFCSYKKLDWLFLVLNAYVGIWTSEIHPSVAWWYLPPSGGVKVYTPERTTRGRLIQDIYI